MLFLNYLFIYLAALGVSHGTRDLRCGMQDLSLWHMGSSSLARDQTQAPCIASMESWPPDHQGSP